MEDFDIGYAKEHLEELIERAWRGEVVRIKGAMHGAVCLSTEPSSISATELPSRPILGQLKGLLTVPSRLFEPLSEEELAWLSGETSP